MRASARGAGGGWSGLFASGLFAWPVVLSFVLLAGLSVAPLARAAQVAVGGKSFNESYILAEVVAQLLEARGYTVERRAGLGATLICYEALRAGEIDVYVEYTGTIAEAILDAPSLTDIRGINAALADDGLLVLDELGFNNTYALAMRSELAAERGIRTLSDMVAHDDLRIAFSLEFLERGDGWPGLRERYGFRQAVSGIEHGLAYAAIDQGKIDVTDAYSTDGDLERYGLVTLTDDLGFFPDYRAVPLLRDDVPVQVREVLGELAGRIDADQMRRMNAQVVIDKQTFAGVAAAFLRDAGLVADEPATAAGGQPVRSRWYASALFWETLLRNTLVHLRLTALALGCGIVFGLALGIAVFPFAALSRSVVYLTGLMQTIPSIALLALMIPLFGIGELPAVVALFLYSLLPIVRNTVTALVSIDPLLRRMAQALGLSWTAQLRLVLVPLALPTILAGVKTAAVISIGTATLAAFIGAGGLGQPIVTGLALNDVGLILSGAIPAAVLAVLVEIGFDFVERGMVHPHMRQGQLSR